MFWLLGGRSKKVYMKRLNHGERVEKDKNFSRGGRRGRGEGCSLAGWCKCFLLTFFPLRNSAISARGKRTEFLCEKKLKRGHRQRALKIIVPW